MTSRTRVARRSDGQAAYQNGESEQRHDNRGRRTRQRPSASYVRAYDALYGRYPRRQPRYRRELLPDPSDYYTRHLHALRVHGDWAAARCPFHEDKNPSLSVCVTHGGYLCHACGARGGDIVSFHMRLKNMDFVAAARDLGAWLEVSNER